MSDSASGQMPDDHNRTDASLSSGPEGRTVHPVRVSYTQSWLLFLFLICFLIAWWFPLKLFLQRMSAMRAGDGGARESRAFVTLAYEGVSDLPGEISRQRFREHVQAFRRNGYTPISMSDVRQLLREGRPLPRKAMLLTFDHARKTSFFETRSLLRRLGWKAVMFIWTKPVLDRDPANLRWPYIKEMARSYIWEIGAQGDNGFASIPADSAGRKGNFMTTPMWLAGARRYETLDEFKRRLADDHERCISLIEANTGRKPPAYAYPYGDFGQFDERATLVRRVNLDLVGRYYDLGFISGNKALNTSFSDPRRLNRLLVDSKWSVEELLERLEKSWPAQNGYTNWSAVATASAWIVDWGQAAFSNDLIVLSAPPPVTGAKAWLAGSDLCRDLSARLVFRLHGGQLGVYLRASPDEESYVYFGIDMQGNVWVRQKFVGLEPFTLASAQAAADLSALNELRLHVRDKILFAELNGRPLFREQVIVRGSAVPGMIGLSVWDKTPGLARVECACLDLREQAPVMAAWTPRETQGVHVAGWVARNAYRLTHISPPWLRVARQGVARSGDWDPELYKMLARSYHLKLAPNIWVEKEQWMDTLTPSNLVERLNDSAPDAVFLNLGDIEQASAGRLTRWLGQAGDLLQQRGVQLVVRLPEMLEKAAALSAMLAVIPGVQLAADGQAPLLVSTNVLSNTVVAVESLPMPADDVSLALYYEITGLADQESRLPPEARAELLRQEGHVAFENGEYTRALTIWNQWSAMDPKNEEPLMLIGDAYLRLFEIGKALEFYARSLDINPGQIDLAIRRIRLIDETGQPEEAKKLLNLYARVFPGNPEISLAQSEWLMRRNRRSEAIGLIKRVTEAFPDNITAITMMQGLLEKPEERYANMRRLRDVGAKPIMQARLGDAIWYNELTAMKEFCVMNRYVEQVVRDPFSEQAAAMFRRFLPLTQPVVEDFSLGRLSAAWLTSSDYPGEEGRIYLRAGRSQAEVYLRLLGSDTMRNGFIEVVLDDIRGFFWLYARRARQDMVRYGFDQSGNIYLQVWRAGNPVINESKPWFKPRGKIKMRLDIQGDGAGGYINDLPVFDASVPIPQEMGLGWWGMAPYSPKLGAANATLHYLAAGPLPVQIAVLPQRMPEQELLEAIKPFAASLSAIAPQWFTQMPDGRLVQAATDEDLIIRMFARYHRIRLLPLVQMADCDVLTGELLAQTARQQHLAGFILQFDELPPNDWFERITRQLEFNPLNVVAMAIDENKGQVRLREINVGVGLFPASDRMRVLPLVPSALIAASKADEEALDVANDSVVVLEPAAAPPAGLVGLKLGRQQE